MIAITYLCIVLKLSGIDRKYLAIYASMYAKSRKDKLG